MKARAFYKKEDCENSRKYDITLNHNKWFFGKEEMIKFAEAYLKEKINWIDYKKQKPPKNGKYIVFMKDNAGELMSFMWFNNYLGTFDNEIANKYVTHWMELPDKPEMESVF
jgi:hypothetical protein